METNDGSDVQETARDQLTGKEHFACRIPRSTVVRVRTLAEQDPTRSRHGLLGQTVDRLLVKALDDLGVPSAEEILERPR